MNIVIASNVGNGIGLEKDARLLSGLLRSWGHDVTLQQYDAAPVGTGFDLCIWLEVISEHLIGIASRHYLFANPEWTKPETIRPIQRYCEKVFAKTREGERALRQVFSGVHYVGFLTEDHYRPEIPREPKCLHIGGNSGFRNTDAIISAWREYRYWDDRPMPELTVISNSKMVTCEPTPGITFHQRVSDEELIRLQNSHLFHLYPSAYEGWGHAMREGMGVGAVILTTDAPPMNEIKAAMYHIRPVEQTKNNLGTLHRVAAKDIREVVPRMVALFKTSGMDIESRDDFLADNNAFASNFRPHIDDLVRRQSCTNHIVKIALLGNFEPPYSTENDLLWTLRDMGYVVLPFQEDQDSVEHILAICEREKPDLFIWVHTHGWSLL